MSTYKVTIHLVLEIEADDSSEARQEAINAVGCAHECVLEEDVLECELTDKRCIECCEEMDMGRYDEHDMFCQECEEAMSEEENEE